MHMLLPFGGDGRRRWPRSVGGDIADMIPSASATHRPPLQAETRRWVDGWMLPAVAVQVDAPCICSRRLVQTAAVTAAARSAIFLCTIIVRAPFWRDANAGLGLYDSTTATRETRYGRMMDIQWRIHHGSARRLEHRLRLSHP